MADDENHSDVKSVTHGLAPLTTNPVFVPTGDGGLRVVSVRRANPLAE